MTSVIWNSIDTVGSGSQDIGIGDGGINNTTHTPFGLPGIPPNKAAYCGVNWTLRWKISKNRDLYVRIERKGNENSIYGYNIEWKSPDGGGVDYSNLILRATVFPGTFTEDEKKNVSSFWVYNASTKKMDYHSEKTKFGENRGNALFFDNAVVHVEKPVNNKANFILPDVANPPENTTYGNVINNQKINGNDAGVFLFHFDEVPNPEVSIAITGTGGYGRVDDPVYPTPYIMEINGVKEVVEQILDYYPCSRYFNNAYQSCNRSGGSFQTWHSGAWQDRKNVANNSSKSTTFYYSNGWQIAPKTGANAK